MRRFLLILCILMGMQIQAQSIDVDNIAMLVYDGHDIAPPTISSSGNFVISTTALVEEVVPLNPGDPMFRLLHSAIALWDLTSPEGLMIEPTTILDTPGYADTTFHFSPDERFVAFWRDSEGWILSVPDLEVISHFNIYIRRFDRDLAWSMDSSTLAVVGNNEISLWSEGNQPIVRISTQADRVRATQNGWILSNFTDSQLAFMECDFLLENCTSYELDETQPETSSIYLAGNDTVTTSIRINDEWLDEITLWQRDEDGVFQPEITQPEPYISPYYPNNAYNDMRYRMSDGEHWFRFHSNEETFIADIETSDHEMVIDSFLFDDSMPRLFDYLILDMTQMIIVNNRAYANLGNAVVVIPLETG